MSNDFKIEDMLFAVYEVGSQGVMIDTGFRASISECKMHIGNCSYSFVKNKEYVCLPFFVGGRWKS